MQILLVDDESLELFISKKFLSMEHTVAGFATLPEALQWAKSNSFDVLVSDYNLGGSTRATDVLRELIAIKGKTFKSFVLTNHVDSSQMNELKAAGFHAIIEKPLSLEKFKDALGS